MCGVASLVKYLMMMMHQILVFVLFLCKHVLNPKFSFVRLLFWLWSTLQYPNITPYLLLGSHYLWQDGGRCYVLLAIFLCCSPLLILFNLKNQVTLLIDMWGTSFGSSWWIARETFGSIIFSFFILFAEWEFL